ncbi:MAG: peptidase T [bacterium]|jgi:tripeptide aminopeptidase
MRPIAERLMRYVRIDTQSDPDSRSFPSTEKQKDLSRLLVTELLEMGLADAHLDEWGYVYATIPSNSNKGVPVICFCSHVDTAPDCSGKDVKPILHENYQGQDIVLPDDPSQVITASAHPYLLEKIGDDIITASGLTLLGADDKAGVAIIMELAKKLSEDPSIVHGDVRILFTPDEEVGRGVEHVDIKKLGADYGYTLDGGELGSLEFETFSADGVEVVINGVSTHPGTAKGKMVNAIKIASAFVDALPKDMLAPEVTEGREGFIHPTDIRGTAEHAIVRFIIRDFDTQQLEMYERNLENILIEVMKNHPNASYEFKVTQQYRNMREVLDQHPEVVDHALNAIKACGLTVRSEPVRGGTDGSRLSFMGLPCPNIFTGEMALHSKHEFVSVQDMEKSVAVLVKLLQNWEASV